MRISHITYYRGEKTTFQCPKVAALDLLAPKASDPILIEYTNLPSAIICKLQMFYTL